MDLYTNNTLFLFEICYLLIKMWYEKQKYNNIGRLPYTEAVIHEVHRHASMTGLIVRMATFDTQIGKYFIPKVNEHVRTRKTVNFYFSFITTIVTYKYKNLGSNFFSLHLMMKCKVFVILTQTSCFILYDCFYRVL